MCTSGLLAVRIIRISVSCRAGRWVAGSAPETLSARGEDVRRTDLVSGDADLGEARTKQSPTGDVRLGAGLGDETIHPSVS